MANTLTSAMSTIGDLVILFTIACTAALLILNAHNATTQDNNPPVRAVVIGWFAFVISIVGLLAFILTSSNNEGTGIIFHGSAAAMALLFFALFVSLSVGTVWAWWSNRS